jgi:hypothetical protein
MKRFYITMFLALALATVGGCGIWDSITGQDGSNEVTLKGEAGSSCSLDSECRSNSCVYPGLCE